MKEHMKPMMTLYMKRRGFLTAPIIIALISVRAFSAEPPKAFSGTLDPFSYCASVGTMDSPAGGTGPSPVPPALEPYLPAALGMPAGATITVGSTFWRCMDKSVYVCAVGANLVCDRKADSAPTNVGADNYCRDNPDAAQVPAYATGHNTVFAWNCRAGRALRGQPTGKLDRRGFRIDIWHKLSPVPRWES
jgi:hypothetical protein